MASAPILPQVGPPLQHRMLARHHAAPHHERDISSPTRRYYVSRAWGRRQFGCPTGAIWVPSQVHSEAAEC